MIGHRTRFRENGDLPPWRGSAAKKKPSFFSARALMTREIYAQWGCAMQYWGMTCPLSVFSTFEGLELLRGREGGKLPGFTSNKIKMFLYIERRED